MSEIALHVENVPSVLLPKTGGGTASFTDVTDTTAAASDVASGKYFYTAAGVRTAGTSSGGGGGGSVTQDQDGYIVLPSTGGGGGGGASNIVAGTFTTNSTAGVQEIDIPYTGNGYPVTVFVRVPSDFSSSINYPTQMFLMTKVAASTPPLYDGSNYANRYTYYNVYPNSNTFSASSGPTGSYNASGADAIESGAGCMRLVSDTKLSIYVRDASYGFAPSSVYSYIVVYSE